ncbi:MAG: hypothetical protein KAR13_10005 [Desulfobulbaceae bacterium]|nr:hypothetical protein [Desulfobulbaceae bacterium]
MNLNKLKGIGSGIRRALYYWREIDFMDDREGCIFTATVHRTFGKNNLNALKEL